MKYSVSFQKIFTNLTSRDDNRADTTLVLHTADSKSKCKAICFMRARVKDPLNYSLMGTLIPEASSCKYLGIILHSDLSWVDQVNYTVKKAWKALHFTMRILIPKV